MEHSEAAYDWYNASSKADIIAFCDAMGVTLLESDKKLIDDWADVAMAAFDSKQAQAKRTTL